MYTTTDERGILNNYATEPKMYYAKYPSQAQQRRYMLQGAFSILLFTGLLLVAAGVS
ncbi:ssl1498 family light-harvesting-like protein [Oxynema sp. CENA135]|jgi:hypothetical protein|uniref:photosystem II assembly protein Psb34 n=1 Tax=Oxynema sp. CENA135 TaxID=984206 RepID=UPI00190E1EC2|nr:ssl1498 family light-harvesting-like protein [Oxynema sp. CENA135]MBK4729394.1 ssl1498 family light-harvesting-like protein [Oxynema sp. CENA135]MBK4732951.1 ssl1498 family light-harvesting-like protein [Oxynema sp. CENA135]